MPEIEIVAVLRERLWENPDLINQFINDSGGDFEVTANGIQILKSWENRHINDTFLVVKYTPEYAVLMPVDVRYKKLLARFDETLVDFLVMRDANILVGGAVFGKSYTDGYPEDLKNR